MSIKCVKGYIIQLITNNVSVAAEGGAEIFIIKFARNRLGSSKLGEFNRRVYDILRDIFCLRPNTIQ